MDGKFAHLQKMVKLFKKKPPCDVLSFFNFVEAQAAPNQPLSQSLESSADGGQSCSFFLGLLEL